VVSGLALGIDGAAHHGALAAGSAPPVGVVASGLDVVYPRRHAWLWYQVATRGVLLSESPLGTPAAPWRFPLRNRIIASLAQVVVVVECHRHGGALHTVEAATVKSSVCSPRPRPPVDPGVARRAQRARSDRPGRRASRDDRTGSGTPNDQGRGARGATRAER
jgi:DNA processing protein